MAGWVDVDADKTPDWDEVEDVRGKVEDVEGRAAVNSV